MLLSSLYLKSCEKSSKDCLGYFDSGKREEYLD